MTVELGSAPSTAWGVGAGRGRLALLVAVAIVLVLVGYLVGSHRGQTREVTGPANVLVVPADATSSVGHRVAEMEVDGVSVGVSDSIMWIGPHNDYRERGWPDCLGSETTTLPAVTFGIVRVDWPNGQWVNQVVYVDCRTRQPEGAADVPLSLP
jgi:hypothetical protein